MIMKKHLLSFACLVAATTCSYGQTTNVLHEIQAGYSPMARPLFYSDLTSMVSKSFHQDFHFSNSYQISYRYKTPRKLTLGFSVSLLNGKLSQNQNMELQHTSIVTAFEPKFSYVKKAAFELYFFAGAGVIFNKNKTIVNGESVASQLYTNPTTQLTPLGIRAGKKVAVFAEIGYGYKGIVNLGLSSRF
jgi:hypothetical protein